ncbi:MAG: cysteine hydrolase family protein [Nanoarchaeota archaeon]
MITRMGVSRETLERSALLVIDMQQPGVSIVEKDAHDRMIAAQKDMIRYSNHHDIPILFIETKGQGETPTIDELVKEAEPNNTTAFAVKVENNAFLYWDIEKQLRLWKKDHLILTGINASACVLDSAVGAINKGYAVSTAEQLIEDYQQSSVSNKSVDQYRIIGNFLDDYKDFML